MIELRHTGPEDWALWRDIRLRSLADSPTSFAIPLEVERQFREADWRARTQDGVLVLEDGVPVAMGAGYRHTPGWLMVVAMWVEPAARGQGLATRVLDEIVRLGLEQELQIELWVTHGNDAAWAAYLSYGFEPTGETEPLRDGSDLLVERMTLPEESVSKRFGQEGGIRAES